MSCLAVSSLLFDSDHGDEFASGIVSFAKFDAVWLNSSI
jgi:hypothetical protein